MRKVLTGLLIGSVCSFGLYGSALAQKVDIERLNATWNQAFNSRDAKAVAALYDEKATLSPGDGKVLKGRAEIEKLFKSFIDAGVHNHKIELVESHASGNMAFEVAKWSADGAEKDGKKPSFGGVLTNVFRRGAGGQWKSISHVWNTATP